MALLRLVVLAVLVAVVCPVPHRRVKRIVGGTEADPPVPGSPTVLVEKDGDYEAAVTGTKHDGYLAFEGIRYAEPPVGEYRFQRARKLKLEGDVDATKPGTPCPQPDPAGGDKVIGSEDCLFLNVFTPRLPADAAEDQEGLPVMVWIHGGGFRRGSASQYGPKPLVSKSLVLVPIQYRLGSLGFLSSANRDVPGNVGLFDMALAVEWVKEYISFFGGDPQQITLSGQGSGGSSAMLLTLSSFTNGSVSRVAALSGTPLSSFAVDNGPKTTGGNIAKNNGCPETPALEMIRCMQSLSVKKLIQTDSQQQGLEQGILNSLADPLGTAPVVDGEDDGRSLPGFVKKPPLNSLRTAQFPDIPLLTGVTSAETGTAVSGKYRDEVVAESNSIPDFWNSALQGLAKKSGVELFSNVTNNWLSTWTTGYESILQGGSSGDEDVLTRLIEATGDALFNVQAFEMVEFWSRKSSRTYLYSFDHQGAKKGGPLFLAGLPLVAQGSHPQRKSTSQGPSHGDDLIFLFDALPLTGRTGGVTPSNLSHPDDIKVRDIYTDIIAQFVKNGVPGLPGGQPGVWPSFQDSSSSFLKISSTPQVLNDFRYCQMALWTGLVSRLQDSACAGIKGVEQLTQNFINILGSATATIFDPMTSINTAVGTLSNLTASILPAGNVPILGPLLQPVQVRPKPQSSVQAWPPRPRPGPIIIGGGLLNPFGI